MSPSSLVTVPHQVTRVVAAPPATGDQLLSRIVNWMIRTPPIFGAMKFFAKQAMVSTAEKAGIDWTAHVQRMQQEAEVGTANCSCMWLNPCQQKHPTPTPPRLAPYAHWQLQEWPSWHDG